MVIGPTPDLGIEQFNQGFLLRRAVHPDGFPELVQERFHVFGRRLDQKRAVVFAYILPEKIEAFRDTGKGSQTVRRGIPRRTRSSTVPGEDQSS